MALQQKPFEILGLKPDHQKIIVSELTSKYALTTQPTPEQLLNTIKDALCILGYYAPQIEYRSFIKNQKPVFSFSIKPGTPLHIRSIQLILLGEGKNHPALLVLIKECLLRKDAPFEHPLYEATKEQLLSAALDLGYLTATFVHNQVEVDLAHHAADVRLILETGPLFHFGSVYFKKPPFPSEYLKYYIPFKVGDPYQTNSVFALQKNLIDSDLFKNVHVEPKPLINELKVPLNVSLEPKARHQYTMSVGFGTDTGPRARLQWHNRRRTAPGHNIQVNAKSSQRMNEVSTQYRMPFKNPATHTLVMSAQIVEEKPVDKKYSLRHETTLAAIKKTEAERTLSTRYLSESFRTLPTDPKRRTHFLLPTITYLKQNSVSTPDHQHVSLYFNLQGGLSKLASSTNIVRAEARFKWIIPIQEKTRLLFRTNLGAMDAKSRPKIPLSLRFFAGGDQSIRGFGYQSLGPTQLDAAGRTIVVGGRYLMVGTLELERIFYKKIGGALFADAGNAVNTLKSASFFYSAGFGLRYKTPLGALKVDIAQPLLKGKHKPRLHLNFGMDF